MKIALLLLTIDNPYFSENIKELLNENTKLYIHAKFPEKLNDFFKKYLIKNLIDTKWGDMSLVNATINLLEEAWEECDYFYLISGDTYIINKPEKFNLSCFDFLKKYDNIYKTSQWWGLNKTDAKTIIKTRNKYANLLKNIKLNGAYDENYFLTILKNEIPNYEYIVKNIMQVKWLDNVIAKHPFIFNKLTFNDVYLFKKSFFLRKCTSWFKFEENKTLDDLLILYIGSKTNQNDILKQIYFQNIDMVIITSIEITNIMDSILKNAFYIIPIIWKFYDETVKSLSTDIIISSWKNILFTSETFDYYQIKKTNINILVKKYNVKKNILTKIYLNNNNAYLLVNK